MGEGDPCKVPITTDMMRLCKGACTAYEHEMREKREKELQEKRVKEEQEREKQRAQEDERKRQAEVTSIRDKNKAVDEEMKKVEDKFKEAENLAKESSVRMEKALKEKDMSAITVAHELQEIARKRNENAREKMKELNKRREN